jgi:hypothetical protein
MTDLNKIARDLHDIRFDIQDMAGDIPDAMGRWLNMIAGKIEDAESDLVSLQENDGRRSQAR